MKKKNKLRAGVIGLGVGAHQARSLSLHSNTELVWLCDLNKDKLLNLKRELPEAKITQNQMMYYKTPILI